ncbi:signal peptidase I [Corynebacterium sp. NPDC060344]|uniref:signal peptidase I n=1 Tax=Corynebacterium sp. NPDC060344 TaxID=3347101 RepID=UPI00365D5027
MSRHRKDGHSASAASAASSASAAQPARDSSREAPARKADGKRPARKKSKVGKFIAETVLTLLAIFGVICAGLAIAAWTMNIGIILFKTGSMAPEIPTGSMAIVRTIPAEQAQVGDVVTVERPNQMPITHRVTSNVPDPGQGADARIIEMKGDANPGPDPFPYHVTEVREVLWSKAGWGEYVVMLSQPWTMVVIVLLASAIVTWAFWPRGEDDEEDGTDKAAKRSADKSAGRAAGTA